MCYSKQRVKDASRNQVGTENSQIQNSENTSNSCILPYDQTNSSPNDENSVSQTLNKNNIKDGLDDLKINDHGANTKNAFAKEKTGDQVSSHDPSAMLGKVKQVHLHKHDSDELGMAILGGIEHGLPIMISEVFPGSSVARSQKVNNKRELFLFHVHSRTTLMKLRFYN